MDKKPRILDEESFDILALLIDHRGLNFQRIIDDLGFNRNSTHKRLGDLVELGLVKEENHGKWRRGMEKIFLATKKGESHLYQKYTDDLNVVLSKIREILEKIQENPATIRHFGHSASETIEKSIDENKPYNPPEKPPQRSEKGEWPDYVARWEKHRTTQRKVFGSLESSFRRITELVLETAKVSDDRLMNRAIRALEKEPTICIELASEKIRIELDLANGSAETLDEYPSSPS